jgi:RNA polymerase sigma-70 factor (ECF subfamily)
MIPPSPEQVASADRSQWFAEQVQTHESSLRFYLHGSFPCVRDVDDVVQESYLRVWKARAAQPIQSARAFLFKVARHVAVDLLRRRGNSPLDAIGDLNALCVLDDRPSAVEALSAQEKLDLLADAVMALPARCREIVLLRKIRCIPQKEVAALRYGDSGWRILAEFPFEGKLGFVTVRAELR